MLTATLIKPARLNANGRTWERDVTVPVDLTTARILSENPRFKVEGLFAAMEALAAGKTLDELGIKDAPEQDDDNDTEDNAEALAERIRDAVADLDVDDEESFLEDGKPNPVAVSLMVGEDVTAEQVEAATATSSKGKLEAADKPAKAPARKRSGGIRVKTTKAPAAATDEAKIEV